MFTYVENYEETWLQCNHYDSLIKTEACNILNRIHDFILQNPMETGSIFDNWLLMLTLSLFLGFIITSLYQAFTEEPEPLTEIRSRVEKCWKAVRNLSCAIRLTQELQKRNEILKIEQIKNYMLTQFPEREPIQHQQNLNPKEEEEPFELPINLETISTDNISMKPVKSLIASALSRRPAIKIPMSADFSVTSKYGLIPQASIVEAKICKVQFDLSKRECEVEESVKLKKIAFKPPPYKLIISKEDLIKMPDKCRLSLTRNSSVGEPINKVGIFKERKKMFERSEVLARKPRASRRTKNITSNEKSDRDETA